MKIHTILVASFLAAAPLMGQQVETVPAPKDSQSAQGAEASQSRRSMKVVTNSTTNRLAKFVDGAGTVADSAVVEMEGKVGIGTSLPFAPLHIHGSGQSQFYLTSTAANPSVLSALAHETDNVSIGFDVDFSGLWRARSATLALFHKYNGHLLLRGSGNNPVNGTIGAPAFTIYQDVDLTTGVTVFTSPTVPNTSTTIAGGNVIAGNTLTIGPAGGAPATSRLVVHGSAHFNGTVTGSNIVAHYQDLAEWVPSAEDLSPGTVVVIDKRSGNTVKASSASYDTSVAGVVSVKPGIILGEEAPSKEQIATTGRVRVRVDASKGAVEIGDLLVTSNLSGTAMKSAPIDIGGVSIHRPGTIIGKALEPLDRGVGEILVLLSLQ